MSSGATVRRSITSTEIPSSASALGGRQRLVDHAGHRDDRHVGPGPDHGGPADRARVVGRRLRSLHAVEQPVLDEDHRVGVLDGRPQQAVGVGRRRGHDDGQARDVGQQGLEALRVLAARGPAGAELGPHGQRHLGGPAGHERQLGRLVEQLVEADADEVEVHQLDHGAHAGHGRADAQAHDGRLGDRRVAHPVAEPVAQAPGEPEDVAALADVDAGDEHPVVASSSASSASWTASIMRNTGASAGGAGGSAYARPRPQDEVGHGGRVGAARPPGRLDGGVELAGHRRLQRLQLVVADPGRAEPGLVHQERVTRPSTPRPPRRCGSARDRPRSGRASGRSRPRPHRASAGPHGVDDVLHGVGRRHDVVAVDGDVGDAVAGGPALEATPRAGSTPGRTRRSRCSRRRRPPAAATRRPGSSPRGTPPGRGHRRRRRPRRRRRRPRSWDAAAAPTAIGTPAATIPLAPKIPRRGSAMCIEPPRPRLVPSSLPISSANMPSGSSPLARQCPWPRWVEVMTSAGPSGQHAPTAAASCPIERWTKPGTSPSR